MGTKRPSSWPAPRRYDIPSNPPSSHVATTSPCTTSARPGLAPNASNGSTSHASWRPRGGVASSPRLTSARRSRLCHRLYLSPPVTPSNARGCPSSTEDVARGEDVNSGEEIGERILEREADREAADPQRGERRRDRDAERLQDDQDADHQGDDAGDVGGQRSGGERAGEGGGKVRDDRAGQARGRPADRQHDEHEQRVPDAEREPPVDVEDFEREEEAGGGAPQHGGTAQHRIQQVAEPGAVFAAPGEHQILQDEADDAAADREGGRRQHGLYDLRLEHKRKRPRALPRRTPRSSCG